MQFAAFPLARLFLQRSRVTNVENLAVGVVRMSLRFCGSRCLYVLAFTESIELRFREGMGTICLTGSSSSCAGTKRNTLTVGC